MTITTIYQNTKINLWKLKMNIFDNYLYGCALSFTINVIFFKYAFENISIGTALLLLIFTVFSWITVVAHIIVSPIYIVYELHLNWKNMQQKIAEPLFVRSHVNISLRQLRKI